MSMTFYSLFKILGSAVSGSLTLPELSVMLTTCTSCTIGFSTHVVLNLIQQTPNLFVSVDVSLLHVFVLIAFYFVVHLFHFLTLYDPPGSYIKA